MALRDYHVKEFSEEYDFARDGGGIGFIPFGSIIPAGLSPIRCVLHFTAAFTSGGAPFISFSTATEGISGGIFPIGTAVGQNINLGIVGPITVQAQFGITVAVAALTGAQGIFYMQYLQLEGTD